MKKYKNTLIGIAGGMVLGYAYYYFVGCASGNCAITSNPINSSLYGALMGGLLGSSFKNNNNKKEEKDVEIQ